MRRVCVRPQPENVDQPAYLFPTRRVASPHTVAKRWGGPVNDGWPDRLSGKKLRSPNLGRSSTVIGNGCRRAVELLNVDGESFVVTLRFVLQRGEREGLP